MADDTEPFDPFEAGEPSNDQTAEGASSLVDSLTKRFDDAGGGDGGEDEGAGGAGSKGAGGSEARGADAAGAGDKGGDRGPGAGDDGGVGAVRDGGDGVEGAAKLEAPAHWPADQREAFGALPEKSQKFMVDRLHGMEAAHTQRSQEIAPLRNVVHRWGGYLRETGSTAEQAFETLMNVEHRLRSGTPEQKMGVLRELVTAYGITAPEGGQEGEAAKADPRVDDLDRRVAAGEDQRRQEWEAARYQNMEVAAQEVGAFKTAVTEAGKLAHPHFGEVEQEMARLARADLAARKQPNIEDLYKRACWGSDTVREKMLSERKETDRKAAVKTAAAKRNAGSSISGAGSALPEKPKDLRASLRDRWEEAEAA